MLAYLAKLQKVFQEDRKVKLLQPHSMAPCTRKCVVELEDKSESKMAELKGFDSLDEKAAERHQNHKDLSENVKFSKVVADSNEL